MSKVLDENLIYEILSVVEETPKGKVASYGQIARCIGGIADACMDRTYDYRNKVKRADILGGSKWNTHITMIRR